MLETSVHLKGSLSLLIHWDRTHQMVGELSSTTFGEGQPEQAKMVLSL